MAIVDRVRGCHEAQIPEPVHPDRFLSIQPALPIQLVSIAGALDLRPSRHLQLRNRTQLPTAMRRGGRRVRPNSRERETSLSMKVTNNNNFLFRSLWAGLSSTLVILAGCGSTQPQTSDELSVIAEIPIYTSLH